MADDVTPQTHIRLMTRMARTVGADLDVLSDADWGAALTRCCSCGHVGSCEDWLEDAADGAAKPPSFCANSAVMRRPSL